jgi:DNA-binding transcriptional LysR family regulator
MIRVTLKQLSYFVAVADAGSLAGAAKILHVSQPSISAALSAIENTLDVDLFLRHHAQGVSLTPTGRQLLGAARAILAGAEDFESLAQAATREPAGLLRIGCYPTLAAVLMPAIIGRLAQRFPKMKIEMIEGTEDELLPALERGDIEQALLFGEKLPDRIKRIVIERSEPYVLLPKAHPLARKRSVSLRELANEPFILMDTPAAREHFLTILKDAGISPQIAHRSSSFEVVRGLVGQGLGFSLLVTRPKFPVTYDGLELAYLAIKEHPVPAMICLVRMPAARTTRLGAIFQEACLSARRHRGSGALSPRNPPPAHPAGARRSPSPP